MRGCAASHTSDIKKYFSPRVSGLATRSLPRALHFLVYTATVVMVRRCAALIRLAVAADWTAPRPDVSIILVWGQQIPIVPKYDLWDRQYNRYACIDTSTGHQSKPSGWGATWRITAVLRHATSQPNIPLSVLIAQSPYIHKGTSSCTPRIRMWDVGYLAALSTDRAKPDIEIVRRAEAVSDNLV
jgi:hypothetical protein